MGTQEIPKVEKDGQVLIKTLYLSVDPYMRGRMNDNRKSYIAPFEVDQPITGFGTGKVVESKSNKFKVGDIVTGPGFVYSEYWVLSDDHPAITKVHEALSSKKVPLSYSLSVMGMPGLTAYF